MILLNQQALSYDPSSRYELDVTDVVFYEGEGHSLPMTIFRPRGEGLFPALLRVHGGAWNTGQRQGAESIDRQVAECGMVVAAIDFRLAPSHPYPAQIQDTNLAVRWLKLHAEEYSINLESFGGAGDSSGGHTMLLNAMRPHDARYSALSLEGDDRVDASVDYVIAMWPVLDSYTRYFYARGIHWADKINQHENYFLTTEAMREASPQMILERGENVLTPPVLIIQGDADDNIPRYIPLMFEDIYRGVGASVQLEWFPGMHHGFAIKPGWESSRAIEIMRTFLAQRVGAPKA
jgi:acetyl esterase